VGFKYCRVCGNNVGFAALMLTPRPA
jgi:hypothetical protein